MADHAANADGESSTPDDASAVEPTEPESEAVETEASDDLDAAAPEEPTDSEDPVESKPGMSHVRLATIAGLVAVVALAGLTGWLGYRAHESKAAEHQRELFLQVGRQGAINLTTLDFEHIDGDVQRILDSATGTFYDDFQNRSASFTEVVKQVKSKSVGSVTSAGLVDGSTPTEAQVLVAVTVKSEIVGQPEQPPRSWRMRISVQKIDDQTKVSNVEFVPWTDADKKIDDETVTDAPEVTDEAVEADVTEAEADEADDANVVEETKPSRSIDWARVVAFGVLPALALVLALAAGA